MKKILVFLLIALFVFPLAGCGMKEKIEQKVTEKVVEKAIESAVSDENTKVDISEGKITFKGKDGETAIFGGTEWPDIDTIPEFKKGNVVGVVHDNESNAMITIEEVAQKDFEDYLADIKDDFTENVMEMNMGDVISYAGEDGQGNFVQVTYDINGEAVTILITKNEK